MCVKKWTQEIRNVEDLELGSIILLKKIDDEVDRLKALLILREKQLEELGGDF